MNPPRTILTRALCAHVVVFALITISLLTSPGNAFGQDFSNLFRPQPDPPTLNPATVPAPTVETVTTVRVYPDTIKISIYTGDVDGAGTDANIDLTFDGGQPIRLNPLISVQLAGQSNSLLSARSPFQRNQTDVAYLNHQLVYGAASITITSDNSGLGSAWYLGWVDVKYFTPEAGGPYRYTCNCWIQSGNLSATLRLDSLKTVVDMPVPTAAENQQKCHDLVQRKVAFDNSGSTTWSETNVNNLCQGTPWPEATVECFKYGMPLVGWQKAITQCSPTNLAATLLVAILSSSSAPAAAPPTTSSSPSANGNPGSSPPTGGSSGSPKGVSSGPTKMQGNARDIDAKNGSVWIVGTNREKNGYGIYHLDGAAFIRAMGGPGAVHIAVDSKGDPWIVDNLGRIYRREGEAWVLVAGPNDTKAVDIAITREDAVWIVTDQGVASKKTPTGWSGLALNAKRIDYLDRSNVLQIVDGTGKRWTRKSATSWVIADDPSGMAARYNEYAVDRNGTGWGVDSSSNIWRLPAVATKRPAPVKGNPPVQQSPQSGNPATALRTITFKNQAGLPRTQSGFAARMIIRYFESAPNGATKSRLLVTEPVPAGQSRTVALPKSAPNSEVTVHLIARSNTTQSPYSFYSQTFKAASPVQCIRAFGTLSGPHGGPCK